MRLEPVRTPLAPQGAARPETGARFGSVLAAGSPPASAEAAQVPHAGSALLLPAALDGVEEADRRAAQERQARRHARAMLTALARLQIGLLSGDSEAARGVLADLAAKPHDTDDAALRGILREIGLRAAVELARAG